MRNTPRVPRGITLCKPHHRQSDNAQQAVGYEDYPTRVVFIANIGAYVHDYSGEGVRGCNETLGLADAEAHSFAKDYGEEVGDCVGYCCEATGGGVSGRETVYKVGGRGVVQENETESPDFQIKGWFEEFAQGEGFYVAVVAVLVDTADDISCFTLVQEAP